MLRTFSTRDKRRVRLTYARWRRRAIFLLGGVAVGAAAVALAQAADLAQQAFAFLLAKSRYIVLAITPLGFMLSAYLTIR
ncbi:MAG: chloride channel protein, partial [Bradyrhizobium sp.]|nr:chloride channel protein [Bradyrhizobium sp.]